MSRLIREYFAKHRTGTLQQVWAFIGKDASGWTVTAVRHQLDQFVSDGYLTSRMINAIQTQWVKAK